MLRRSSFSLSPESKREIDVHVSNMEQKHVEKKEIQLLMWASAWAWSSERIPRRRTQSKGAVLQVEHPPLAVLLDFGSFCSCAPRKFRCWLALLVQNATPPGALTHDDPRTNGPH